MGYKNSEYYFKEGVTFNRITVSNFSTRYLPKGLIIDCNGPAIYGDNPYFILGLTNSLFFTYLLTLLSPTISYQVGDVAKVPFQRETKHQEYVNTVTKLSKICVSKTKHCNQYNELSFEYFCPSDWQDGSKELLENNKDICILESIISEEIYKLYDINKTDIYQMKQN